MPRPQFSIRTLLWLTLVVAAFLGGVLFERARIEAERRRLENMPAYELPQDVSTDDEEMPALD